ncbi:hypothetical protein CEP53_005232 [Fusarium sp. AF-6]|nr:hypothetical protein CEP53_005232 [Fusarium sp. AF-6]
MMGAVRSNRVALLVAAVFFTFFMGLAHFHLNATPSRPATAISDSDEYIPDVDSAAAAASPNDAPKVATKAAQPPKASVFPSAKAEEEPGTVPAIPTPAAEEAEIEVVEEVVEVEVEAEEETPTPTPTPTAAESHVLRPQDFVIPSVKPTTPEFADYGAWGWKLPHPDPIWKESLGERLCIVDLESRPFDKPGQIWDPQGMSWSRAKDVHGPSGGTLNHWVYSQIHGYKYYYVKINTYKDRRDSWKKPSVLSKILKNHEVCVFIDSDALFNHLDLPLEWLMNYWSISPHNNSLALAVDPDVQHNHDRFGKLFLNTGFMIMQNKNKTYDIFRDWDDCPNEGSKYPGCTEFRNRKGWQPTDQGGFGTFVRYDYPNDIKELPCTEANGFPEANQGCMGKFIKHVWLGKEDRLKIVVGNVFPGTLLETFHKQFLAAKDSFFTTEDALMSNE